MQCEMNKVYAEKWTKMYKLSIKNYKLSLENSQYALHAKSQCYVKYFYKTQNN